MRPFLSALVLIACSTLYSCGPRNMTLPPNDDAASRSRTASANRGAFVAGHLYVSTAGYGGFTGAIERYPLTNGVPASEPDLTYPDKLLAQFAVDRSGRLYGIRFGGDRHAGLLHVLVFPPNSNQATRSITPPQPYDTGFPGIIGSSGYAYLAGFDVDSNDTESFCAYNFVLVYAPTARRQEPWATCVSATYATNRNALWMALDANGDLYVPADPPGGSVDVYANPTTDPTLVRTMSGPSLAGTSAVADDAQGHLYAAAMKRGSSGNAAYYVATYDDSGNGNVKPTRRLWYSSAEWQGNVAVDDRYLYVAGYEGVYVYNKTAAGHAKPIATLSVPSASYYDPSVAVGP